MSTVAESGSAMTVMMAPFSLFPQDLKYGKIIWCAKKQNSIK
jgi:hypothetical protein